MNIEQFQKKLSATYSSYIENQGHTIKDLIKLYEEKMTRSKLVTTRYSVNKNGQIRKRILPKGHPARDRKTRRDMPKAYYIWAIKELSVKESI